MEGFWGDLRHAARSLRKARSFTLVAVLTLAIGIGASTAIFSVMNAVLLKPLPYPKADRLGLIVNTWRGEVPSYPYISPPRLRAWRDQAFGVEDWTAYLLGTALNFDNGDRSEQVIAGRVTASFFRMFGARLIEGRAFSADEDRPAGVHAVVLSFGFWQRHRGGAAVIGRHLSLNGDAYTIVGVLDRRFDARSLLPSVATPPDVWVPLQLDLASRDDANSLAVVARFAPTVTFQMARNDARRAESEFRERFPGEMPSDAGFGVVPLSEIVVGDARPVLLLLFAAVVLVSVIVCVNTANLMLLRAAERQREFAIRSAIGASRTRVIQYLLTETALLASAGGIAGGGVAWVAVRALIAARPTQLPRVALQSPNDLLDSRVLVFLLVSSIATALGFGLAPALRASAQQLDLVLRTGGRVEGSRQEARTRIVLLVGQTAIACVLVVASGLLIRSVAAIHRVDLGFNGNHVLTMKTAFADRRFATTAGTEQVIRNGLERLAALPGVEQEAVSLTGVPLEHGGALRVDVLGRAMDRQYVESWDAVTPGYFHAIGIPLLRGRLFSADDTKDAPAVAIINEALARQLWPDGNSLADRILIGRGGGPAFDENVPRQIVGIVGDVRQVAVERAPWPNVYVPLAQMPDAEMAFFNRSGLMATWLLRTQGAPDHLVRAAEHAVLEATDLPPAQTRAMTDIVATVTSRRSVEMWLITGFAVVALQLAMIGIYGVAAHSVQQRTRELGIRLALGADSSRLRNMVVWQGLKVAIVGTAIGLAAALAVGRMLAAFLFGVTPHDPTTFAAVAATLAATSLLGVWIPARRAANVDPIVALRAD